ncbi:hypothetical protein ACH5RR_017924 [Cinchona calisaya]|uniref:Uncharacterized protein n=1 Tax=Cinchona calisaya TaxID=153742 RepID=A0ABD2ZN75_9GENT
MVSSTTQEAGLAGSCDKDQQKLLGFSQLTKLEKHNKAITAMALPFGSDKLFSGSKNDSACVWDCNTRQHGCTLAWKSNAESSSSELVETLKGHKLAILSIVGAKRLYSVSKDETIRVWAATERGSLQVICEVEEESGILALSGIEDAETKPILLCSFKDNTVSLYDLPSLAERGRIFAKSGVEAIAIDCGGLFLTGDATGQLSIWKLLGEPTEEAVSS